MHRLYASCSDIGGIKVVLDYFYPLWYNKQGITDLIHLKKKIDYVTIDASRFQDAIKAYFYWKDLDTIIRTSHTRGINIPEAITETLLCYASNFKLNKGSFGDAYDEINDRIIEIKATSNYDKDTTSFSPKEEFDALFFVRLDKRNDIMYFYDLHTNSTDLKKIKVNSKQTLEDQQKQGRRPRFSVIKNIINAHCLEPYAKIDLRLQKVTKI